MAGRLRGLVARGAHGDCAAPAGRRSRTALFEGGAPAAPGGGNPVQMLDVRPNTHDGRIHLFPDLESRNGLYHYDEDPATHRIRSA